MPQLSHLITARHAIDDLRDRHPPPPRRRPRGRRHADQRGQRGPGAARRGRAGGPRPEALLALSDDPAAYGAALAAQLFADQRLREAWLKARAYAASGDLQLRLRLDANAPDLHALRWETLRDPESGQPIALHERVRLVRTLDSPDLTPVVIPPRPALRALVVVANPSNLADFHLAEVDVDGEVGRARAALGDIPATILGDHADSTGRATMAGLAAQLRDAPPIVILVAHGTLREGQPLLWLEREDGAADQVPGATFVDTVARLAARPLLLILASCRSAGGGYGDTLSALAPGLARAGVPAVLGFQGDVAMGTVKALMPTLISELRRDGQIDRALAAARAALGERKPWWQAVLWLRTDGRVWDENQERPTGRQERLRALLHDHSGFIASRMEAFVGREAELAEIRARIAEKLPTGGYVTITGQAGQGKSSVIARLVADALGDHAPMRERLLEPGAGVPICHFIPFSPGPDHQVGLLRNLIARLCLTYGLPDFYAASDSRPALRDYFAAALRDVAKQGSQEIIYIDGLDQIEEDASGVRDLSFLPEEPPAGIVFVLGTRPNDTLKPLELRKPQHEYWLPAISRTDFDLILKHRGVHLDTLLADRFYTAMQENALYLDLVAHELAQADAVKPEQIIARVADNPANIFSLSIERLQRNERQWETVLRPILGLLLATRAPLSQRALRALIGADDLRIRQGLQRLGGLVQRDGEGRYGLFHLKLGEYLRQDVFAADEEESYQQQFVIWCEGGKGGINAIWADILGDALEQERRGYARQHYIAHLAAARAYGQLWDVIDTGEYGTAKRRYDPSTRGYILDLDIVRQAVVDAGSGDVHKQACSLTQLWRYSLLRGMLTSQTDRYPDELFLALVALGRIDEAVNLAELLSNPKKKVDTLQAIGAALLASNCDEGISVLQRAYMSTEAIPEGLNRINALSSLTVALTQVQRWDEAHTTAIAIPDTEMRVKALCSLAVALMQARHPAAIATFVAARVTTEAIPDDWRRAEALSSLASALAQVQRWDEARTTVDAIPDDKRRTVALSSLTVALVQAQRWDEARATADAIPNTEKRVKALCSLAASLVQAQHPTAAATFITAHAITEAIPRSWWRGEAFIHLAAALAQTQRWDEARAIADAIPDGEHRTRALSCLTIALVQAQRWDEARTTADAIPDTEKRAKALCSLAVALAEVRHPTTTATFIAARATTEAIPDNWKRAAAFSSLSAALAQAKRWDEARATADAIPDRECCTMTLSSLTVALAQAQHWNEARATADAIPITEKRVKVLCSLAAALAQAQHPLATTTFTIARATVDAIPGAGNDAALSSLATAFAQAQCWAEARTIADAIPKGERRAAALSSLATALAQAKRWDEARATADVIPEGERRAAAFSSLAAALAQAQHPLATTTFTIARATVDAIPGAGNDAALSSLATAFAQAQCWAEARTIADAIPKGERRAAALSSLATALAQAKRWDEARATAGAISEGGHRAAAFNSLAAAFAQAQCWDEARTIADAILDGEHRAVALSSLATALAQAQCWDEARTIADTILDSEHRVTALSSLATALAQAQHPAATATFTVARTTADTIPDEWGRAGSLSNLATAQALTQHPDAPATFAAARATAEAIPNDWSHAKALTTLAATLAQSGLLPQSTALLADLWRRAQSRDELLRLFIVPPELLRAYPELGQAFLDGFAWVDAQLAAG